MSMHVHMYMNTLNVCNVTILAQSCSLAAAVAPWRPWGAAVAPRAAAAAAAIDNSRAAAAEAAAAAAAVVVLGGSAIPPRAGAAAGRL